MRDRWLRLVLGLQAIGLGVVGAWALAAPRSFYDSFPGGGRTWVAVDGPYNEHLVRDVGALNLALLVVTLLAFSYLSRPTIQAAAAGMIVYSIGHISYHLDHLDLLSQSDQIAEVASLAVGFLLAIAALLLSRRRA